MPTKPGMIGEFLMRAGLIDSSGLDRAQRIQSETGVSLGTAIASLGLATEDSVSAVIATRLQLETLSSTLPEVEPEISGLLPSTFCQKHLVAPLSLIGNSLRLAMVDPLDYSAIQDVAFRTSKEIVPVVASQSSILMLLNRSSSDKALSQDAYEDLTGGAPVGEIV